MLVQRLVCRRDCTRLDGRPETLRVDLATGATTPLDPCPDDREGGYRFTYTLRGTVLGADCGAGARVTDLADGATRRVPGRLMAAAGTFAAWIDDHTGKEAITVIDWRTGRTISRVPAAEDEPVEALDMDADGTIAWVRGQAIHLLPPGAARATVLPRAEELRLVGGVLATREHSGGAFNRFAVGGRVVDGQDGRFGWAFDGTRLAWVAQPCAQTVVRVWDVAGEPPPPAPATCATARVGAVKLNGRRLRVRLRCPAQAPAHGCAGSVRADLRARGRKRGDTKPWPYKLLPGAADTVELTSTRAVRAPLTARVFVDEVRTVRRVR